MNTLLHIRFDVPSHELFSAPEVEGYEPIHTARYTHYVVFTYRRVEPILKTFAVGMFFEMVTTLKAESLADARKEADKWASGIADNEELNITSVEVVEVTNGQA